MLVVKKCKCGCKTFYKEDDGTLRCDDCNSLAVFESIKVDNCILKGEDGSGIYRQEKNC